MRVYRTATFASHMQAAQRLETLPDVATDIRTRVRVEQMKMVFGQTAVASLAATAFAMAWALHLHGSVPTQALILWITAKILVIIPRIVHGRMFDRRSDDSLSWLYWGRAMLVVDGLAWGAAGVFLMPPHDVATMTVIVATLTGVSSIAAFVLHTDWASCVAYTAPMLLPAVVTVAWRGDSFGLYGGIVILIFLALLLLATRRSERHVVEMLTLRFANEALTAQLSSALELARQENRAKNEFVANMSHELRTPLHGILGVSSMLLGDTPISNLRESVTVIRRCGEHLLGLINNILEYSRFGAQGIDIQAQQVDLAQLIDDTVQMCVPGALEKQISLHSEIDLARPCIAILDPFRLRQVLLNLIGNAVKFTEVGSVRVHVAEAGDQVQIRVEDTGMGIAPTVLDRIFEPFVQLDSSNTRRFGGTGLGLSITRAICEAMGAHISYQSKVGKGSTFEVLLPLKRPRHQPAPHTALAPAMPAISTDPMSGTVLLAEDNEVNAIVAEAALRQLGISVERASTGRQVVDRLCQPDAARPDLVLLDCQMPEMDGFEAARRVRDYEAEHGLPRLVLVALTANVFPQDREQCRAAGMDEFLAKPFSSEQLRQLLTVHLPVRA